MTEGADCLEELALPVHALEERYEELQQNPKNDDEQDVEGKAANILEQLL
jgi:hypothetical protein